jgi:hypothetical protein
MRVPRSIRPVSTGFRRAGTRAAVPPSSGAAGIVAERAAANQQAELWLARTGGLQAPLKGAGAHVEAMVEEPTALTGAMRPVDDCPFPTMPDYTRRGKSARR